MIWLLSVVGIAGAQATPAPSQPAAHALQGVEPHWTWCNQNAVKTAPAVVWVRIRSATSMNSDIPVTYWRHKEYRNDIAKIVCYESSFDYHAKSLGQYGWFQMSSSLIAAEGVTFGDYWSGSGTEAAGWYQCTAGERYIDGRYGTPAAAWAHEKTFGWY